MSIRDMAAELVKAGYDNPEYKGQIGEWYHFHADESGWLGEDRYEVRIKAGFFSPTVEKLGRVKF